MILDEIYLMGVSLYHFYNDLREKGSPMFKAWIKQTYMKI